MERLSSRKLCAAFILIAGLATLVSAWGVQEAGHRALSREKNCETANADGKGLELEMASSPEAVQRILATPCIRAAVRDQVRADYLLIPAYSGLTLALLLFTRAQLERPSRDRRRQGLVFVILGLLLSVAMLAGDVFENLQLTALVDLVARAAPRSALAERLAPLGLAGQVKWGALALSGALLGVLWKVRSSPRLVWVLRLLGLAAAAVLGAGLLWTDSRVVGAGMLLLVGFWLAALLHAITVAVEPEPIRLPEILAGGTVPP